MPEPIELPAIPALIEACKRVQYRLTTNHPLMHGIASSISINLVHFASLSVMLPLTTKALLYPELPIFHLTLVPILIWGYWHLAKQCVQNLIHSTLHLLYINNAYNEQHQKQSQGKNIQCDESGIGQSIKLLGHYIIGQAALWLALSFFSGQGFASQAIRATIHIYSMYWNGFQFFLYPLGSSGLNTKNQLLTLSEYPLRSFTLGAAIALMHNTPEWLISNLAPSFLPFAKGAQALVPLLGLALAHEMGIKPIAVSDYELPDKSLSLINPATWWWYGSELAGKRARRFLQLFGRKKPAWLVQCIIIAHEFYQHPNTQRTLLRLKPTLTRIQIFTLALTRKLQPHIKTFFIAVFVGDAMRPITLGLIGQADNALKTIKRYKNTVENVQHVLNHGVPVVNRIFNIRKLANSKAKALLSNKLAISEKLAQKLVFVIRVIPLQNAINLAAKKINAADSLVFKNMSHTPSSDSAPELRTSPRKLSTREPQGLGLQTTEDENGWMLVDDIPVAGPTQTPPEDESKPALELELHESYTEADPVFSCTIDKVSFLQWIAIYSGITRLLNPPRITIQEHHQLNQIR